MPLVMEKGPPSVPPPLGVSHMDTVAGGTFPVL